MLDEIDLTRTIDADEYKRRMPALQDRLYAVEQGLLDARRTAVIVFEGWAGTSKVGTIRQLTRRLDPRSLRVYPITPPNVLDTQYPWLHRFWLKTPSYGQVAMFDRSWYREVIAARTQGDLDGRLWRERCEDIVSFERQLADDGALVIKFWLHISGDEQRRRFRKLEKDPLTAWQVTEEDRWQQRHYKRVYSAAEELITRSDAAWAPWVVLPATDGRYVNLATAETIVRAVESSLGMAAPAAAGINEVGHVLATASSSLVQVNGSSNGSASHHNGRLTDTTTTTTVPVPFIAAPLPDYGVLRRVDLTQRLDEKRYSQQLSRLQAELGLLGIKLYQRGRPAILVFEGWDAAGKGGAIQRITSALDPRGYVVHAIAAPSGEDKEHHYLYRFWRRLPAAGTIGIFDRSWYGRVLVERVEGFAHPTAWQRSYGEINEFERGLVEFGAVVCKFWLHLSPDEQLRRFEERQTVSYKAWKLTDEDWRNRAKWPEYERAVDEMIVRTSTPLAPWTIVEAEDKRFARIKVLQTLVRTLESELGKA